MYHQSHLCVHRGENSLSWLWQWVYDFFLFPVTEGKGKYFSVVKKKSKKLKKTTINVSLCDAEKRDSGEECDIWLCWLLYNHCTDTHLSVRVCVHTHSGTMRSLCMYECHTSVSHWAPPTLRMLVESTSNKQNHLEMLLSAGFLRASQSVSRDDTLVLVIHQRKLGPVESFMGEGTGYSWAATPVVLFKEIW